MPVWRYLLTCIVLLMTPAMAHNYGLYNDSVLSAWYANQKNMRGEYCCNKADGHDFYGNYSLNADTVEFDADGVHYILPNYMVLLGPNPTGHAVWWYITNPDGSKISYCFAVGPQG
jgi:hypothetical protein